jgi:hypothetical protein
MGEKKVITNSYLTLTPVGGKGKEGAINADQISCLLVCNLFLDFYHVQIIPEFKTGKSNNDKTATRTL